MSVCPLGRQTEKWKISVAQFQHSATYDVTMRQSLQNIPVQVQENIHVEMKCQHPFIKSIVNLGSELT